METFEAILGRALARALATVGLPAVGQVVPASDTRFGDYQTNAALVLAQQLGENPRKLAQQICEAWDDCPLCEDADDRGRRIH